MTRKNSKNHKSKGISQKAAIPEHDIHGVMKIAAQGSGASQNVSVGTSGLATQPDSPQGDLKRRIPFIVGIIVATGGWLDLYNNAISIPFWLSGMITFLTMVYCLWLISIHSLDKKKMLAAGIVLLSLWTPRGLDQLIPKADSTLGGRSVSDGVVDVPEANKYQVYIESQVLPVKVFCDNRYLKTLDESDSAMTIDEKEGEHSIFAEWGKFRYEQRISLTREKKRHIVIIPRVKEPH